MKIAFNPSTVAALTSPPDNKDITFDLRGRNIFARGVKFYGTDTNTWRDIKVNNVSIGSHTLDLRNGSNTTLTNTNGVVTINSTWRPVVDNLTSDSTTSSLSAKQGKVLKALIDGKSNSDHNHDGRYVRKSGDTMSGVLTIDTTNFGALTIKRNDDANGASIQFRGKSNVYGYIGLNNSTKDKQFLRWNSDTSKVYTILDTSSTYTSSGKGVINGTTITQVDNATNATNSTNARKLVNWYSARPTSLNAQFGDGSLRIFYATSSTTEGKPAEDSHILHLAWDNTGGWDAQLAVHVRSGKVSTRAQNGGTWQPWKTLAFTTDIPSSLKNPHSFNVFGVTYDGSAAKTVTTSTFISQVNEDISTITDGTMLITSYASNSGFADTNAVNVPYKRKAIHLWEYIKTKTDSLYTVIGHTHDDRYLRLIGGTMTGTINRRSGGSTISGRDHAIIRQTYAPGGFSWNPIACVDTETGTWTLGHLSAGSSNTDFNFCFSTNADYNAGNNNGNYVTLRNRAGIIALTSEIPSKGSWNYDDRYYTKAESNAKYITDITTSVNKLTFTKNGSSIARTITVNNVQSLGRRSPLTERNAISGIYTYGTYSATDNLAPTNYFETLGFGEGVAGTIEIGGSWISGGKLYWRALRNCCEDWFPWKTILDSSNYSGILDSRYYTESEVNSLLSKKLDRVNLSVGTWNPRGYNLAADYHYNGGDLSISENGGKMYVSIDGYFWQNEGQYRVLDISDVAGLKSDLTIHQYLSATDATWWPLIWGGSSHANTSDSTGAVYKSHDKLSWQTSSQTLYATNIQTENIKRLSIGGGIYWNPCVESTTDDSDAASITLVKSGVAGGTTLVLSQLNDANDTIQFQTNGAAKLYHNSYPILTTQNTYVNNRKGYIYGTEITQVNNSDTVDGQHADKYIMVPTTIDASTLDVNTYYPVTIWLPTKNTRIEVEVSLDSGTKPSWSTHNRGFTTRKVWESNGSGWGTTSIERNIFVSVYSFALEDPVRGIGQLTNSSIEYVYVRGGGKYFFKVSVGSGTPTLQKATYTTDNQSIAPTKTAPALITPCINTPHKNVTLWGQNFNGTNNVSGSLINTGTITPAAANVYNIGTSGNFYNTIYSRVLCGETSNTSVYHQIAIGYPGHDRMDFDEYGGAFYFNKTSSASRYTVATITSGGLYTTNAVTYGLNGLQYFNQVTGTTSGATNNANPYNAWFHIIRMNHGNGSGYFVDLATAFNQDAMYFRRIVSGQDKGWRKILHDGNSSISGDTITINGSSLTVSKSDHNHDGRYAISENYGGFTRTGRLPISGFYQSYESTSGGNAPWTSQMHLINCQHSNINNNYALQIAASFYDNNTFKIRVTNNNVNNAWKNIIHSGNIGAQSVNYANSAGNADKVDGYHATDGRTFNGDINWGSWNDTWSDGTNKHPWYGFDHRYPNTGAYSTTITDYFGMTIKTANTLRLDFSTLLLNGTSIYDINVASATNAYHLRINSASSWSTWYWAGQGGQPTWLWGSNDGTNMYVWNPSNFNVNTAQYLRSLGNQNCQTGRTQNYGNIYSYNTREYNTGAPESYTSVIGFGRGAEGTVEIAGGWCNSNLYWRSLRDVSDNWYSWRTVLDSSNYTNFINNYYWANIKISTSANTQTTPSVNTIYANNWFRSQGTSGWYSESYGGGIYMSDTAWIRTYGDKSFYCNRQIYSSNSIRMSDILLERANEINNITNGPLHLNYRNTGNVTLCNGGGAVTIGTAYTDIGGNKLFVNGSEFIDGASNVRQHVFAKGFRHRDHNSNDAVLLAGGGYSQGVPVKYWAIYSIYIGGSSTDNSYYKLSGNYNFISNMTWEQLGSAILNINFPSGYNKGNTLIFGNGDHMMDTNWSTPVYVTITTNRRFGQASNIRVMISDDSSFNTGFASIYFMCMG